MIDGTLKSSSIVVPITAATLFSLHTNPVITPVVRFAVSALHTLKSLLEHTSSVVASAFAAILFMAVVRCWLFNRIAKLELEAIPSSLNPPIRI